MINWLKDPFSDRLWWGPEAPELMTLEEAGNWLMNQECFSPLLYSIPTLDTLTRLFEYDRKINDAGFENFKKKHEEIISTMYGKCYWTCTHLGSKDGKNLYNYIVSFSYKNAVYVSDARRNSKYSVRIVRTN